MGVSNNLLHRHNVLCIDDLVIIDNKTVGIITSINQLITVKNIAGNILICNKERLRLSTDKENENALRQLLSSL